jgi:hypothetical protein
MHIPLGSKQLIIICPALTVETRPTDLDMLRGDLDRLALARQTMPAPGRAARLAWLAAPEAVLCLTRRQASAIAERSAGSSPWNIRHMSTGRWNTPALCCALWVPSYYG